MAEGAVSPAGCAIAVAIPLTREAFIADLDPSAPKDFAKHVARHTPGLRPEAVWDCYRPVAERCRRVLCEIAATGTSVLEDATLPDVRALLAQKKVVTFVGHWRFPPIGPDDIVDLDGILRRLREPKGEIERHIALALRQVSPEILERREREALAAALTHLLDPTVRFYVAPRQNENGNDAPPPLRLTRVLVEETFPDELRAAGAIELRDGLHTAAAFIESVPESFAGVIDLTVCNSVILGEAIKRKRRGCLVAVNEKPASLLLRLVRHKYVMHLLASAPARFTDVVNDLSLALLEASR